MLQIDFAEGGGGGGGGGGGYLVSLANSISSYLNSSSFHLPRAMLS